MTTSLVDGPFQDMRRMVVNGEVDEPISVRPPTVQSQLATLHAGDDACGPGLKSIWVRTPNCLSEGPGTKCYDPHIIIIDMIDDLPQHIIW
jgi:hypothetical protein